MEVALREGKARRGREQGRCVRNVEWCAYCAGPVIDGRSDTNTSGFLTSLLNPTCALLPLACISDHPVNSCLVQQPLPHWHGAVAQRAQVCHWLPEDSDGKIQHYKERTEEALQCVFTWLYVLAIIS
jgi:hypothetical protein